MEIKIGTKQILLLLNILSWIIFAGLCFDAGGIIFNNIFAFYKPVALKQFWNGADLSAVYALDKGHFVVQALLMSIVAVLKALIFYLIIKLFYNKQLSISKPFEPGVTSVVFLIAWLCFGAGLFSNWGSNYAGWLKGQGVQMPDTHVLRIDGGDVWLFMAVVLMVIGQVFKKGIELQTESDLTV